MNKTREARSCIQCCVMLCYPPPHTHTQGWREKILEGSVGGHVWGLMGHPWQSDFIYRFFKLQSGLFGFVF